MMIKKYILQLIGYCVIMPLAVIVPKADYVTLITRFGDFEGNLKYLFLYLSSLDGEKCQFVFLTDKKGVYDQLKNSGFKVWYYPGFLTMFRLLRTRLIIVDGNEWSKRLKYFFLHRSKKVQVWHGTGLKAIGLLRPEMVGLGRFRKRFVIENIFYDLLVLSSDYQVKVRASAFRYGRVIVNGLPRNDIFFKREQFAGEFLNENRCLKSCLELKDKAYKLVTYAPTWRERSGDFEQLSLANLNDFALQHRLLFIIKLHPKDRGLPGVAGYDNILEYSRNEDVYPLLTVTDLLITDYSSIYLDFLLTDRPIIFYPFDSEQYIGSERELLVDYDQVTPGPVCYRQQELEEALHSCLVTGSDLFAAERKALREKYFKYVDGKSSERLWRVVKESLLSG